MDDTGLWMPDESNGRGRTLYAGVLAGTGLLLAGLQLPHLFADMAEDVGPVALATGAVLPLCLALAVVAAGVALFRRGLRASQLRRVDGWFFAGLAGMTVVSVAIVVYELLEGARLTHIPYVVLDFATAGGVAGILVGVYDAGNRRRQRQLQVFREVVDHGGHSIYLTAPDGTIEYVNPQFERQTGYDRTEAVGRTPRILNSGVQDDAFYAEMWRTIEAGDVWHADLVNERRDGTSYHVDQTIAPVTDDRGDIEHYVAINRDISARKDYEAELERQNRRLDQFASAVSHDLRNPLTVASGRLELLREECDSEHLPQITDSLSRMERLIDDVLALARNGSEIDSREPVSLRTVCLAAWEQFDSKDAKLSVRTDRVVEADAERLQQVFENLFRNSVEHGSTSSRPEADDAVEHGGQDVTITVTDIADGFAVVDTGDGLPDETETLFQSGYTTETDGTGLGLAIVSRIVEAHGWEIGARNDDGARFEITGVRPVPTASADG